MEIINREANIRKDICQRVTTKGRICSLTKNTLQKVTEPFIELMKNSEKILGVADLRNSSIKVREKNLAKARILKMEQNGGYILTSGLTCIGILAIGTIIFITIKFMVLK